MHISICTYACFHISAYICYMCVWQDNVVINWHKDISEGFFKCIQGYRHTYVHGLPSIQERI